MDVQVAEQRLAPFVARRARLAPILAVRKRRAALGRAAAGENCQGEKEAGTSATGAKLVHAHRSMRCAGGRASDFRRSYPPTRGGPAGAGQGTPRRS